MIPILQGPRRAGPLCGLAVHAQTMISGIHVDLLLDLRTKMYDPRVYVASWGPTLRLPDLPGSCLGLHRAPQDSTEHSGAAATFCATLRGGLKPWWMTEALPDRAFNLTGPGAGPQKRHLQFVQRIGYLKTGPGMSGSAVCIRTSIPRRHCFTVSTCLQSGPYG